METSDIYGKILKATANNLKHLHMLPFLPSVLLEFPYTLALQRPLICWTLNLVLAALDLVEWLWSRYSALTH